MSMHNVHGNPLERAAATTHEDFSTRASNLEVAFRRLADDSDNLERQLGANAYNVSPNDRRVAPWMSRFRQRLDESRRWINDLKRQITHHDFNGQEHHFESIQRTMQEADDRIFAFGFVVSHENTVRLLVDLFDCAGDLRRDFGAWSKRERQKNANPPQLHATRHAAEMPPAPRGNEDQDVNPGESLARTGNKYLVGAYVIVPATRTTNGLPNVTDTPCILHIL